MDSISVDETQYISNYNCSYCGSVNIQYKAKEDTSLMKDVYPYLCIHCWAKMPRILAMDLYKEI